MDNFNKLYEAAMKKGDYVLYHDTYTSAVDSAIDFAVRNGYTTDAEERAQIIGFNSSRPKNGQTEKVTLPLYKGEKLQRKALHFQVYNRGLSSGNTFELNTYIG